MANSASVHEAPTGEGRFGRKRARKEGADAVKREPTPPSESSSSDESDAVIQYWVQCDACRKWRTLATPCDPRVKCWVCSNLPGVTCDTPEPFYDDSEAILCDSELAPKTPAATTIRIRGQSVDLKQCVTIAWSAWRAASRKSRAFL